MVCLSGNGRTDHIYNRKGLYPIFLRFPESGQTVRRLSGLAHYDHQPIFIQKRFSVTEFGSHIHTDRDLCQILHHILSHHPHMIRRAAGHNINLGYGADLFFCQPHLRQIQTAVFQNRIQGI